MRIPLASSGLRKKDIDAAINTLNSGMLTMGVKVKEFETEMARYLGKQYFVMMNSGSSANLAIFEALMRPSKNTPKLVPGDGILVPAIAWPTTVWPIVQLGLIPIFIDIDVNNIGMDLEKAQEIIARSNVPIKGLFPIHPLGYSLDNQKLASFAKANKLILINDVCESLGSWRKGVHAGSEGLASSFSFYFSHHITTMEGGGVATDDLEFADDLRAIRSHGWSRDRSDVSDWTSSLPYGDSKFLFVTTGFNIRPMEIQASIGLLQIADIDTFITRRRFIAKQVMASLQDTCLSIIDGGCLSNSEEESAHSWMLLGIRIDSEMAEVLRAKVLEKLALIGIETRPILTGNFLDQPAVTRIRADLPPASNFPGANKVSKSCFMVSAHHDLTDEQIKYLSESLRTVALSIA